MSDSESIKKMLRAVLQSKKTGVAINRLQAEFSALCGENIPVGKLGFSNLEAYLRSIPNVVQLKYQMGEVTCFAAVCQETAHIAELVARQKTNKKSSHPQYINCKMRFRPHNSYMFNVRPRSSLRQPSVDNMQNWMANRSRSYGNYKCGSASGDYRRVDQKLSSITPVEHRQPVKHEIMSNSVGTNHFKVPTEIPPPTLDTPKTLQTVYDVGEVQKRIKQILNKYHCGLWVSKLPEVYSQLFNQNIHPQVLIDLKNWPTVCKIEKPTICNRADMLIYPSPNSPAVINRLPTKTVCDSRPVSVPFGSCSETPHQFPSSPRPPLSKLVVPPKNILAQPTFIYPSPAGKVSSDDASSSLSSTSPVCLPEFAIKNGWNNNYKSTSTRGNQSTFVLAPTWTPIPSAGSSAVPAPVKPVDVSPHSSSSSLASAPTRTNANGVTAEVYHKIKELLSKYCLGLWTTALPKLFADTYKMPFPENILDDLATLHDMCIVEYPFPCDKKKAILYYSKQDDKEQTSQESSQCGTTLFPSGLEILGSKIPPPLPPPEDQHSSVLVTATRSGCCVTVRYVGKTYSGALEAMEDAMNSFYDQNYTKYHLSNPMIGHLVAVKRDKEDDASRAQVLELVDPNMIKLYLVDHGLCLETERETILELHEDFLSVPFQAINVRLAGLEEFSSHSSVLSCLKQLTSSKILVMQTLEPCQQNEMPLVLLYDTSLDDDVIINSCCLKSVQDKSMNNPLCENAIYHDVHISNVCADGTLFCQLPSRGTVKLAKLLKDIEAYFNSRTTLEFLVTSPHFGKFCLTPYKGKWARAEIVGMCGMRIIDISFMDLGVSGTVEVTDLREIPLQFLKEFTAIPPQTVKCHLADLDVPDGDWNNEAILWLKELVLEAENCKVKILKSEKPKEMGIYIHLFIGAEGSAPPTSINSQLAQSEVWQKLIAQNEIVRMEGRSSPSQFTAIQTSKQPSDKSEIAVSKTGQQALSLPLPLSLPQPGESMDVFVPVVCHPGYFVLQPWQDMNKLVVLMGEMMFFYNNAENTSQPPFSIQKGDIYAALIDKIWYRVQVKATLTNGLISVYELDYGRHELVRNTFLRPLMEEFRQLPFQAMVAQLAGVTQRPWSEEAALLFRNHVERRPLVARVHSELDVSENQNELWNCRVKVYLVDTSVQHKDIWIHDIMLNLENVECIINQAVDSF